MFLFANLSIKFKAFSGYKGKN